MPVTSACCGHMFVDRQMALPREENLGGLMTLLARVQSRPARVVESCAVSDSTFRDTVEASCSAEDGWYECTEPLLHRVEAEAD